MRVLTFDGDARESHNVFNMLMTAWHYTEPNGGLPLIQIGTTPERIECAIEINRALREASHEIGDGRLDLKDEGAVIHLRPTAFEMLKESWTAYRRIIPARLAELAQATDAFLNDAPKAES